MIYPTERQPPPVVVLLKTGENRRKTAPKSRDKLNAGKIYKAKRKPAKKAGFYFLKVHPRITTGGAFFRPLDPTLNYYFTRKRCEHVKTQPKQENTVKKDSHFFAPVKYKFFQNVYRVNRGRRGAV